MFKYPCLLPPQGINIFPTVVPWIANKNGIRFRQVAFQTDPDTEGPEEPHHKSEESDDDGNDSWTDESSELEEELGICRFITEAHFNQFQVRLVALGDGLKRKGERIPPRRFLTNTPSTSLESLLERAKLTEKHQAILSYLLVHSVWQYYDSKWEDWSSKTVQFMSERIGLDDSLEVIFVNRPFLSSRFDKNSPDINEATRAADKGNARKGGLKKQRPVQQAPKVQERKSHKYPKILALGILLLEIQLGRNLKSLENNDYYDHDRKIAQHLLALDLLKDKRWWPPKNGWMAIKEMVEICIDDKKSRQTFGTDRSMVRQKLYEQIVVPFQALTHKACEPKGIEDVEPVTLERVPESDLTQAMADLSISDPDVEVSTSLSHMDNEGSRYVNEWSKAGNLFRSNIF